MRPKVQIIGKKLKPMEMISITHQLLKQSDRKAAATFFVKALKVVNNREKILETIWEFAEIE